ncbi:MAG: ATP-dependent helicase [Candidatus Ryanbacteria bacterium CG10_big_fil_rev_8_21_14_0_10_43_42]|uniref:ATP-dependent helicase n=1 Tax=Candidatus Ryanbacteria bacterium CG10_big_fil_rev_8_21_14_0_10_43_42 TaxID=1974864 RepID=A0A2M8KWJ8_9BACT|nr:MAG: ATP-dependent helicase [Candidatus Ryanbacteria bacterium CG10_big_fil_rev_8_21_14_0_10_43_42]
MYNRSNSWTQSPGRSNNRRGFGQRRSVPSRGRFQSGRGRGGKGAFSMSTDDISIFINKAVAEIKTEEHIIEHSFADFALHPDLARAVRFRGYTTPTPIQDKIISHVLKGTDVVGLANTGTGKTGAFLIPLIHNVLQNPEKQVLIIAPTRELAVQIEREFDSLIKRIRLYAVVCVGGANMGAQIRKLRQHSHFIIGTPGRLMDLMKQGALNLEQVGTIVLDEADRMLDMGFIDDVRFIMSKMPRVRHTLCFSATMSRNISNLINDFLINPVTISVKTGETAANVEQEVVRVRGRNKMDVLYDLLKTEECSKVLVFGKTKYGVQNICDALYRRGIKADAIHGDKSHGQRQRALRNFKENKVQTLVATDVASRGLDISNITHVINFDIPATYDDYVHRIGRTGRGTKKGKALTFIE